MTVFEFYEKYPTKEEKEKALSIMSEEEFRELIDSCGIVQAKISYKELYTALKQERERNQ